MRFQLHHLELVYPPLSNQEAEWVKDDKDVNKKILSIRLKIANKER